MTEVNEVNEASQRVRDVRRKLDGRRKLDAIAPLPEDGTDITARALAAFMAVRAQERFHKGLNGAAFDAGQISAMGAEFAAEFALRVLAEHAPAEVATETASKIWGAICDGGGIGEWLWEHLGDDTSRKVTALTDELIAAQAGVSAEQRSALERLRNGGRELGKTVVHMSRSMRAARIEMLQNGPEKAMEWILNSLPDVDDSDLADQWDGRESATEWLDRIEGSAR